MSGIRVWVDGALVDAQAPAVSAVDHGVTVGDGGFETVKVEDGVPFAVSRHLARMDRTMAGLGLPPADHARIRAGIDAVLGAEPIPFGRLRWTVTGGHGPLGSDRSGSELTYIVTATAHDRPSSHGSVVTVPWVRNERSATAGLKTTSYADNVVALARAKDQGAIEAIFGNTRGELCEATGSNVFVVRGSRVLTPPLDSGCLAGITRELVLEWCRADGIDIGEQVLPLSALADADEAFLTSSLKDVLPISTVDGRALGWPGPLTSAVQRTWARHAGGERPVSADQESDGPRRILRDPADEDDWAWRRAIRANPTTRRVYRVVVGLAGLTLVAGGLALVPLPGPGWLIVILGVAIWASEFDFAARLLDFVKSNVRRWEAWLRAQPRWVAALVGLATAAFVAAVVWGLLKLLGVPSFVPDGVTEWMGTYLHL